jgi:hypothetical protein
VTPPSDDRPSSATAVHEASAVLDGLAGLLDRVDGVFAEDAAADARHLRDLAAAIAEWFPPPSAPDDGGPGAAGQTWQNVLAVYVAHGLQETTIKHI